MKRPCPKCGEKKDHRPHTGPPRPRLMCNKCGTTFATKPPIDRRVKGVECKHCGDTKNIHPWQQAGGIRYRCGSCNRIFRASYISKQPKPVDASISAIYKAIGAKQ